VQQEVNSEAAIIIISRVCLLTAHSTARRLHNK